MKQTVLITGGSGYIGSGVVKGLLENGHTIRLTVKNVHGLCGCSALPQSLLNIM